MKAINSKVAFLTIVVTAPTALTINRIEREGKHVVVHGDGFDAVAVILSNGVEKKTLHDSDDLNEAHRKEAYQADFTGRDC